MDYLELVIKGFCYGFGGALACWLISEISEKVDDYIVQYRNNKTKNKNK